MLLPSALTAQQSLKWRTFKADNNTWLISSSNILVFSSSSQSVRPVTVDPVRQVNSITDAVEYDGSVFLSTDAGLYKVNISSQNSERIPFPDDQIIQGKIAVDIDYQWLANSGTLYKYDVLGGEWQSYPLPEQAEKLYGVYSTGDEVFCVDKNSLYRFTVSTEKWNVYKNDRPVSDNGTFVPGKTGFKIVEGTFIRSYQPSSFSWDDVDAKEPLNDLFDEDSVLYISTGSTVMRLTAANGIIRPLDIPGTGKVHALTKQSDTLIIAAENRIIGFDTRTSGMDFIQYPSGTKASEIEKTVSHGTMLVIITENNVAIYDKVNRAWTSLPLSGLSQEVKKVSWNDEGLALRYTHGIQSVLKGYIEDNITLKFKGYEYDTTYYGAMKVDSEVVIGLSSNDPVLKLSRIDTVPGLPLINLNFQTTDAHDRNLTAFFNNTSKTTVPEKGISYQGNREDRLNSVKIGTTSNDQLSSVLLPATRLEGGSFVVDSKKRVENRDRKMLRFAAGTGYITTRTEWRTLPFRSDGVYYLKDRKSLTDTTLENDTILSGITDDNADPLQTNKDTISIVPGSVKVWVDGELLDSTFYTFFAEIAKLQFSSSAPVDPVSAITVQYKVQTIPDGRINDVEFVPEHNFGLLYFGGFTISPLEWLSTRVGFTGLASDTMSSFADIRRPYPIVSIGTPVEVRRQKLLLKINPEFSYNMTSGARAGSISMQSRIGDKTGLIFNGMAIDTSFISTDTLSYGYGKIKNQYDFNLSHDIIQEIPLSYYQHSRRAKGGTESRYAAQAGLHFPGFPYLDITASRTTIITV